MALEAADAVVSVHPRIVKSSSYMVSLYHERLMLLSSYEAVSLS
jgi:hypothetical protein